jgi:hypothetical protein
MALGRHGGALVAGVHDFLMVGQRLAGVVDRIPVHLRGSESLATFS